MWETFRFVIYTFSRKVISATPKYLNQLQMMYRLLRACAVYKSARVLSPRNGGLQINETNLDFSKLFYRAVIKQSSFHRARKRVYWFKYFTARLGFKNMKSLNFSAERSDIRPTKNKRSTVEKLSVYFGSTFWLLRKYM